MNCVKSAGKRGHRGGKKRAENAEKAVCLSKTDERVIPFQKQSVKPKQERYIYNKYNNKYIYLFNQKIDVSDRGKDSNPEWIKQPHFTIYQREYRALQQKFNLFGEDRLDELLSKHNGWLEIQDDGARRAWWGALLAYLRTIHNGEEKRLANPKRAAA